MARQPNEIEGDAVRGPGFRTFLFIADDWKLSKDERAGALGVDRASYERWTRRALSGAAVPLPLDVINRLSAVHAIYEAVEDLPGKAVAADWLRKPNPAPSFGGRAPIALIASGDHDRMAVVRRHVGSWGAGNL